MEKATKPQTRNIYYQEYYGRQNRILRIILHTFLILSSYPKLVMEVFLRRDMGERYYNLASAMTAAFLLICVPIAMSNGGLREFDLSGAIGSQPLWYLFCAVYIAFSFRRWWEIRRGPSVFDFGKFSFCTGKIWSKFYDIRLFGQKPSPRTIEVWYEPLLFFIAGILLMMIGQLLGGLFVFCAVFYSVAYSASYMLGDHLIMNIIDKKIMNEDMQRDLISDSDYGHRGTKWYIRKPNTKEGREELANMFLQEEDASEVV